MEMRIIRIEDALERMDKALYEAKNEGKNRYKKT